MPHTCRAGFRQHSCHIPYAPPAHIKTNYCMNPQGIHAVAVNSVVNQTLISFSLLLLPMYDSSVVYQVNSGTRIRKPSAVTIPPAIRTMTQ